MSRSSPRNTTDHRTKPLTNVSVVSLALNLPGPLAAAQLRGLGASVVKVEPPEGDPLKIGQRDWYEELHEGIEVIRLDLKEASSRQDLHRRLAQSDLLVTAFRLSTLARLGLGWPHLSASFSRLCQVAILGHSSATGERPGHDLNFQAESGLLTLPHMPRSLLADLGGALQVVSTALALILNRLRHQASKPEDRYAEVSLAGAAAYFAQPLHKGLTQPGGVLGGGLPQYNLYRTKEGWIAVAALEAHFRERLNRELRLPNPTKSELERALLERTARTWESWAEERDLPISAVR